MGFLDFIPFIGKVIDRVIPDPQAAADAKIELMKLQINDAQFTAQLANNLVQSQLDINKVEATSDKLLVAGWRPFIGWVCGTAFACNYVIIPIVVFCMAAFGHPLDDVPKFEMGELMPVLAGLLGLGALRSYEKVKGVKSK